MLRFPTPRRTAFALVSAGFLLAVALSSPAGATSRQPPATPTPQAPGIRLAKANFDMPDPFLLAAHGRYFMYFSSMIWARNQNVPLIEGRPGRWSARSKDAVPTLPKWAATNPAKGGLSWEPEVYRMHKTYVMYFAPTIRGSLPVQHCIALATSNSPSGPFKVRSEPFICQRSLGGDIDAQLFVDKNGPDGPAHPNYLIWKSDNNITPGDGLPQIWAQPLSNDGRRLIGAPSEIYAPDQLWEENLIEAPQMALAPDHSVWLFFSAGAGFDTPHYGIGVVHCLTPLGPCRGADTKPILTSNQQGFGPGEETYFRAHNGSDWLLYSPWYTADPFAPLRPVEAARIGWGPFGPYLGAAGTFPPP